MGNIKFTLKHYWIFLVTIIFYCIGFAIHFIAQNKGPHPHYGKEILEKVSPQINSINDSKKQSQNETAVSDPSKYATPDNLFYFIQISDVHMSDKYKTGSQGHLLYFLKKMIPVLDPHFLFITGDITDSFTKSLDIGTVEEDWIMYRKIIDHTDIVNKNNGTFLWDMRGNHDCFMIPEWNSKYNYYKDYSHTKTRGFSFQYDTSYGTYSFVGLDGCPILTTTNPFFGVVDEVSMDMYTHFMDQAKANPKNKHNFVFMHYPETTAKFGKSTSGKRWNDYTKDISLLLTGHFHNLGGNHLYAYHRDYLELELNDFKMHGKYRIVSVDNDVVSISDNTLPLPDVPYDFKTSDIDQLIQHPPEIFNQDLPPIVHITLPKNSKFNLKRGEPIQESYSSPYIRVLVFSSHPSADLKLSLYLDDKLQEGIDFQYVGDQPLARRSTTVRIHPREAFEPSDESREQHSTIDFKTPPLWIAPWDSSRFNDGQSHTLKVVATDPTHQSGENTIKFRLDGKKDSFGIPFISSLVMKSVLHKSLPVLFGIVYILYELMILLPRLYSLKHIIPRHPDLPFFPSKYIGDTIAEETERFRKGGYFKRHFVRPFIEAFTFDGIFYPLQLILIWILVLPSKIGVMTRSSEHVSKIGGEFLYGTYTSGQWSNVFDQYGMYLLYLILFPIVDTFVIASMNYKREPNRIYKIVLLIVLFLFQLIFCIAFSIIFGGIMAIFLSPFPNWICLYCWVIIFMIMIRRRKEGHSNKSVTPEQTPVQV